MTRKKMGIASMLIVLAIVTVAAWVASSLPAGVRLPTHWDASGQPNGFSGKWAALMMPAVMAAVTSAIIWFLPALEPRGSNLERSQGLIFAVWASLLLVSVIVEFAVVAAALQWGVSTPALILVGIGLMFVIIGNQLGKSRSMFLVGFRTPWTLSSEEVWIKTHRLGGKLMVIAGLLLAVSAFLPLSAGAIPLLTIAIVAIIVFVPIVYSYLLWRRERRAN